MKIVLMGLLVIAFDMTMVVSDLICSPTVKFDSMSSALLDVNNLTREVIKRNPDLDAVRFRIKAAAAVVPRVQVLDDPKFLLRSINHAFGRKREFIHERRYKLSQKIPFPGKLKTQGQVAKHILSQVRADELTTHQDLILQTKKLYFQLYLNGVERTINEQNQNILTRFIKGALALYKTGRVNQVDALKGHIELQRLEEKLLIIDSDRIALISLINALVNRKPDAYLGRPIVTFQSDLCLSYEKLEKIAMKERPELHGLAAKVKEQDKRAKLGRLNYFPDFDLEFMLQEKPRKNKMGWGVNLGFNLPIWIGRKQRNEVREAKERSAASKSNIVGLQAIIRSKIQELLAQIKSAKERVGLYESGLLAKTAQTLAVNETYYRSGRGDFLTVLDTRRQLQDFELDYERTRIEREILLAELERELGVPLEKLYFYTSPKRENKDERV